MDRNLIFLGVGGTGIRIVGGIKRILKNRVPEERVKYLGVDIGTTEKPTNLDISEFIDFAKGGEVGGPVKDKQQWPYVAPWWPRDGYTPEHRFEQGTNQMRLFGRMALYLTGSSLLDRISGILNNFPAAVNTKVVVIGSSGGGTGTGLFADIPSIVRAARPDAQVIGILLLHDVVTERYSMGTAEQARARASSTSLLEELNSIIVGHSELGGFAANVRGGLANYMPFHLKETQVGRSARPVPGLSPYNLTFVIGLRNSTHGPMRERSSYEALAAATAASFCDGYVGLENVLGNVAAEPISKVKLQYKSADEQLETVDLEFPVASCFASFGTMELVFPEERVLSHLIRAVATSSVGEFLRPDQVDGDWAKPEVDTLVQPIAESNNQDRLLKLVRECMSQTALSADKWKYLASDLAIQTKIKRDLALNDGMPVFQKAKDDWTLMLAQARGLVKSAFQQKEQETLQSLEERLSAMPKPADRLVFLERWHEAIGLEAADVILHEQKELSVLTDQFVGRELLGAASLLAQAKKPGLLGLMKPDKNKVEAAANTAANTFVRTVCRQGLLDLAVTAILEFYLRLQNRAAEFRKIIEEALSDSQKDLASLQSKLHELPARLYPVLGQKPGPEFVTEILVHRDIVDSVLTGRLNRDVGADVVKELLSGKRLPQICEELISPRARDLLMTVSIGQALRMECEHVVEHQRVVVTLGARVAEFPSFLSVFRSAQDAEFNRFLIDWAGFFGEEELSRCRELARGGADAQPIVEELFKGRASLALKSWSGAFWEPDGKKGRPHCSLLLKGVPGNEQLRQHVAAAAVGLVDGLEAGATVTDSGDKNLLQAVYFSAGLPLGYLRPIGVDLKDLVAKRRVAMHEFSVGTRKFDTPDGSHLYFSDRRFADKPELSTLSMLAMHEVDIDRAVLSLDVVAGLVGLGEVSHNAEAWVVVKETKAGTVPLFRKDTTMFSLRPLYRRLLLLKDSDLKKLRTSVHAQWSKLDAAKRAAAAKDLADLADADEFLRVMLSQAPFAGTLGSYT